ncbi:MAG: hypothetical protein IPK15_21975 [Verrucomicrobia bacterium]|nr:hypothetical protein [Verrucomicrobiota bacterium]
MKSLTDQELDKLLCLESSQTYNASVSFRADDRRSYCFSTGHYIDAVIEANNDQRPGAPAQRLTLRFTSGEVMILGSGLERIEDRLAEGHLRGVKAVEPRYASLLKFGPVVLSITVQRKEEL